MVDPQYVVSPKNRLRGPVEVLAKHMEDGEGGNLYSIGRFGWDGAPVVGIRWDGKPKDPSDVGNPQSRGLPTWFILPGEIADVIVERIGARPTAVPKKVLDGEGSLEERIEPIVERVLRRLLDERATQ